jgi:hypothetical protein
MSIQFHDEVHEFSFNTSYFTVTAQELFWISVEETTTRWWLENLAKLLEKELLKLGGGIIWWRIKPEIDHARIGCDPDIDPRIRTEQDTRHAEEFYCWKGYACFATSPNLPEEFITQLGIGIDEATAESKRLRLDALAKLKASK